MHLHIMPIFPTSSKLIQSHWRQHHVNIGFPINWTILYSFSCIWWIFFDWNTNTTKKYHKINHALSTKPFYTNLSYGNGFPTNNLDVRSFNRVSIMISLSYFPRLACESAGKAETEGYTRFAIGYYGECHGTKDDTAFLSYARNPSTTSNNCIHDIRSKYHKSFDESISCAGMWGIEYM